MKASRFKMTSLLTVMTVFFIGLLSLMPVVIFYLSSYSTVYAEVLFSLFLALIVAYFYHNYRDREKRDRLKNLISSLLGRWKPEEEVFKVRVIPLMQLLALLAVSPFALFILYSLFIIEFNLFLFIVNLSFWGLLFFGLFISVLFSWVHVYKWGIRFRLNLLSFDDVSRVRLKWGKRVVVINRQGVNWLVEEHWYLLANSSGFLKKLESLRPELQTKYE
jgi:hypothetical protein